MKKVIFVIGANASGKSYFIEQNYKNQNVEIFNIYDYQQRAYDEAGFKDRIPMDAQFKCLYQANQKLLEDIIKKLQSGRDVVVEQTFYKAKRRIAYIDEIRKAAEVEIQVFIMNPSDTLWESNFEKRGSKEEFKFHKSCRDDIEFPNVAEGIDKIYEVVDGEIKLRMDPPKPELLATAREELEKEKKQIQEKEDSEKKYKELMESMKVRPFWHYCEVCGKKEFLTAEDAYNDGWDYPPKMGNFRLLGPRTCGDCLLEDTLYWKINTSGNLPIVMEQNLTEKELITWRRIKAEPESLLEEE